MEDKRFHVIDSLRGIAALLVLLFHAKEGHHIDELLALAPIWIVSVFSSGDLGVAIFFVLSGFVIAHSLRGDKANFNTATRFLLRRSLRLDPPYWTAIIVTLAVASLSAYVMPEKVIAPVSLTQIVAHLFYLQDILGFTQINPIFWTLCMEIQFYMIYSLILIAGQYEPEKGLMALRIQAVLGAVFVASLWWVLFPSSGAWFYPLFHCFLLGVGAYWSWRHEQFKSSFYVFAGIVLMGSVWTGNMFSVMSAATAILISFMAATGNIGVTENWRFLQFAGLVSYSLYLIHNPITGAAFNVGYRLTGRSAALELIWLVMVVAACLIAAYVMWWLIERPSMALSRKLFRRPVAA